MNFALSSSSIGVLVVMGVSISGLLHVPMGAIADRIDKRALVITGGLITVVSILLVGKAGGFWGLFWANVIFGIGGGISMPALMALAVISGNKAEAMGAVMSLITVAHSLGMLCGSLLAGIIMDIFNLQYAFYLGAVIMVAGTVVFIIGMYTGKAAMEKEQ
jgi:MFS family permease